MPPGASAKGCALAAGARGAEFRPTFWSPSCVPVQRVCFLNVHRRGVIHTWALMNPPWSLPVNSKKSARCRLQIQTIITSNIFFITRFHRSRTKAIWKPRAVCCNGIFLMWKSKHCCCIINGVYPFSTKLTVLVSCWCNLSCWMVRILLCHISIFLF